MDAFAVLVVDGQALVRQALARVLTEGGYAVVTAGDGPAALEALDEQPIDAVVAEVEQLDGIDLLAAVRARRPAIPVVLMATRDYDLSGLGVPCLTKPFDVDELLALLPRRVPVSAQDLLLATTPS